MSERWIVIPNWERFQHYRDRDPSWIKVYTELAHRDAWTQLTLSERGLLVCIWVEYALSRGQLRVSDVPRKVLQKIRRGSLDRLVHAGFIQVSASRPLASRARARSQEEEKEKDLPLTPKTGDGEISPEDERNPRRQGTNPRALGTNPRAQKIDIGNAWALFLTGHGWDETYDEGLMLEELARLRAARKTTGKITDQAALQRWQQERDRRYQPATTSLDDLPF